MRLLIRIGIILVAVGLCLWGLWEIGKSRTFQFFGEIVPRVETSQPVVALTFDDGPVPGATEEVLTKLGKHGVRATFFLTGAELAAQPALGRRIAEAGHEIGNHSFHHDRMMLKSWSFIRNEVEQTDALIRQTGYSGEIHFRAPFCKKLFLLPLYLSRNDRKMITWDLEPDSWPDVAATPEGIVRHVVDGARPGSIILLHVMYKSRRTSMDSVDGIIDGLKGKGYEFKTVSELLRYRYGTGTAPTAIATGSQHQAPVRYRER